MTNQVERDGPPEQIGRAVGASRAVLGADACRAGWVGAVLRGSALDVVVAAGIADLVAAAVAVAGPVSVLGVDIPIGLPDAGPRQADRLARARLPRGRKSSVFPAPTRAATEPLAHPEASAANRAAAGVGLSIQAFHLVPKILDVEAFVRSGPACRVVEVHPEVCFAHLDPEAVVAPKRTPAGRAARAAALRGAGLEPPAVQAGRGYAADDLLDACVVAWTAARVAAGEARPAPDPPERFADGLPAAIWC